MGHPIRDPELDAKVRSLREAGTPLAAIARTCRIGINRVRRICGLPLPPSQTAAGQSAYRETHPDTRTTAMSSQKSITISLTAGAYDRLAAIAETAYLSPEAFAATLVASYLSYQPAQIVLEPSDPEDESEDGEDPDESEGEPEEDPAEDEPEEDKPAADPDTPPDYAYIRPGRNAVLVEDDKESLVWISQIKAKGGVVKGAGDKVRVKRQDGTLVDVVAGELDPPPEG